MSEKTTNKSRKKAQTQIRKQDAEKLPQNLIKTLGIPSVISAAVFSMLILAFSLLLARSDDPEISMPIFAAFSVALSGYIGGYISGRLGRKIIYPVLCGLIFVGFLFGASLFFDSDEVGNTVIFKTVLILCALLSELVAGLSASKHKKRKRKVQRA